MADIGIIKFQLGGMNFCMYSDRIVEIVRYTGVRKIPRPLPYVVGLIELRKHIVVVVDFRKRVGLSPITLSKDTVMIVVNLSFGVLGILVEAISDFRRISEKLILPPIAIAGFPEHLLHGVLTEKDDIMLIPNLDQIFASYSNIRLVPISPSERIAFQYRFTPGALTRTLEGILLSQPALDQEIVRKLPHSLCLPSTLVHRMSSYYPEFKPRQASGKGMEPRRLQQQKSRSADEQYVSLSKRFRPQQTQSISGDKTGQGGPDFETNMLNVLIPTHSAPVSHLLEQILQTVTRLGKPPLTPVSLQPAMLTSQPDLGRRIAKMLQVAPTRLTKYFTYYTSPELTIDNCQLSIVNQPLETRLQELLRRNDPLLRTLQTLHEDRDVLTRPQLEKICAYYQVSPAKLAKLASFFPESAIALESATIVDNHLSENASETQTEIQGSDVAEDVSSLFGYPSTSVSECLQYLAEQDKLSQDRYVRYLAARVRMPTCRLSKLRSYYRWNHEQID